MKPQHLLLGVLAAAIWGAAFVVSAAALKTTPPLFLAGMRFAAAALFVVAIPRPKVAWSKLMLAGLLLGALQYGLLFIGMKHGVAPGIASLLVHAQVFFTIAFAAGFFGERISRNQALGITAALGGLLLLASQRTTDHLGVFGLVLVLLAALAGGLGNIVLKRIGSTDRVGTAVWMSLAPPIPLFAASALLEQNLVTSLVHIDWVTIGAIVYTSVLSTVVAFAVWAMLFSTYPASTVGALQLLVPVFGIMLSVLIEGEVFTPLKVVAALLMFVGLLMISPFANRLVPATPRLAVKS